MSFYFEFHCRPVDSSTLAIALERHRCPDELRPMITRMAGVLPPAQPAWGQESDLGWTLRVRGTGHLEAGADQYSNCPGRIDIEVIWVWVQ